MNIMTVVIKLEKLNNTCYNNALDGQTCYRCVRRQCWIVEQTLCVFT